VTSHLHSMAIRVDPNFEPENWNDEDEDAEDEEMVGCRYDDVDEDSHVIHFDKNNPTIDEGTFLSVWRIVDM